MKRACALLVLCATTATALHAQTFIALHSFNGTDGANPYAAPIQGSDGNLYGTTANGGANGYGTVFKITPGGKLTTLHSFIGTDGASPQAGLVQAIDGNFYGTTSSGGVNGFGTVFRITPSGTLTPLHSFAGSDGETPVAAVVQATDGNLYGTTSGGGSWSNAAGTVFKITTSGTLTTLYSFPFNCCAEPLASLVQVTNGYFYGTAYTSQYCSGGAVFITSAAGDLALATCLDGVDGAAPVAPLIQASDTNLYGTASEGGANGYGTVFQVSTPFVTALHSFTGADGANPQAGLVQAADGNFYGTTLSGGSNNRGTVFEMTLAGALTTLHSFGGTDGQNPHAGLVQATTGNFYGTTVSGGAKGYGTIFELGPQAAVSPISLTFAVQKVGTTSVAKKVTLTNNLSTSLSMNGITFTGADIGDFGQTNTCGASLGAKAHCTISVAFTPTATGTRTAIMNVNDSANNSPQTVSLKGTGQ